MKAELLVMTAAIAHAGGKRLLDSSIDQADQSGQLAKGMVDKIKHRLVHGGFKKLSAACYGPHRSIS